MEQTDDNVKMLGRGFDVFLNFIPDFFLVRA